MKKIAETIVKYRIILCIFFAIAAIACAFLIPRVRVNYNLIKYLPPDSPTSIALEKMTDEFGEYGSCVVTVKNISAKDAQSLCNSISQTEGVGAASFDAADPSSYKDGNALINIILTKDSYSVETQKVIGAITEKLRGYDAFVSGDAVFSMAVQQSIANEMPIILIIAFAIIFLVLVLTSRAWIEPLIFFATLCVAIVINLGTNVFMGEVSFITQSICAILQLALAMDYSIVLLHRFGEEKSKLESGEKIDKAMEIALAGAFSPISGSALTTIAGLFALCLMSFRIGFDIGIVLIKGILVSYLTVFVFMPCLILSLSKAIDKTAHKSLLPKMEFIGKFAVKSKNVVPIIGVVVIIFCFVAQFGLQFSYTVETTRDKNSDVYKQTQFMSDTFGPQNEFVIMLKKQNGEFSPESEKLAVAICESLRASDGSVAIKKTTSLSDTELYLPLDEKNISSVLGFDIPKAAYSAVVDFAKQKSGKAQYIADFVLPLSNGIDAENLKMLVYSTVNAYKEESGLTQPDILTMKINKELLMGFGLDEEKAAKALSVLGLEPDEETTFTKAIITIEGLEKIGVSAQFAADVFDSFYPERTTDALFLSYIYGSFVNDEQTPVRLASALNTSDLGKSLIKIGRLVSLMESNDYTRIIASSNYPKADEKSFDAVSQLRKKMSEQFDEDSYYIAGESVYLYDIKAAFDVDYNVITIVSAISVLLIIMITFRAFLLPVLLVLVIQGAIWINTAASALFGESIFFIAYLILISLQMGATIDYGIVLSDRYCQNRKKFGKSRSLSDAVKSSAAAIITSGTILVVAGAVIGFYSSVPVISVIGLMLARGTLCSLLLIAFLLPALLLLFDKPIGKTMLNSNFIPDDKK